MSTRELLELTPLTSRKLVLVLMREVEDKSQIIELVGALWQIWPVQLLVCRNRANGDYSH